MESRFVTTATRFAQRPLPARGSGPTVFKSAGSDDPLCMAPLMSSQPHGACPDLIGSLCDVGHQVGARGDSPRRGLLHDKEFGLLHNRARSLHPRLGRFLQRDPVGYVDGMSLYEYVGSNPLVQIDPGGLWGTDIHIDLTRELAKRAGIACPDAIARFCNKPDDDDDDRRPGWRGAWDIAKKVAKGDIDAIHKANRIGEWHFPTDPDGVVRKGSPVAWHKVKVGINTCDFTRFSEGLHVLQDSWSHQGRPYVENRELGIGMGHHRGVTYVTERGWKWVWIGHWWVPIPVVVGGHHRRTAGTWGAFESDSADKVIYWPEDALATGVETYVSGGVKMQ